MAVTRVTGQAFMRLRKLELGDTSMGATSMPEDVENGCMRGMKVEGNNWSL